MKVGIIGPYPPPRGGISVHIKRLEEQLHDQGVTVEIYNINTAVNNLGWINRKIRHLKWLFKILLGKDTDIFHIHGGKLFERAYIIFLAQIYKVKTVVTFHSLRDEYSKIGFWNRLFLSYIVNHAGYIIAAGDNEKEKLVNWFNRVTRLSVIPTFIPPKRADTSLPVQLMEFLSIHKFIISSNASNMEYYQGQEIYGLDMLVELCGRLSPQEDVGFVYCLTRLTDKDYLEKIMARIEELNINNQFYIVLDNIEFWPVLVKSHLFIRPTCTDSYGVSVAEALALGVPSIASDVCKRPAGTLLFHSRDSEDLYNKALDVIRNYDHYRAIVHNLDVENYFPAVFRIYQGLLDNKNQA